VPYIGAYMGHIWGQQWGSNGVCMRANMAIYRGSNGAAIGHTYAYT